MNDELIKSLGNQLRGALLKAGDAEFEAARAVYNAMHDKHPALIVQASDVADVVATVNFAREQGRSLAIRGGGHSVPGYGTCDDGIVLDLGKMNSVYVNPDAKIVRAEGGCTLGDLDHVSHAYGLAVPGGTVSTTGLAGLTLGGGMGHLSRSCGLSCDNLISADVVTAAGEIITCDKSRHPDLFWAIRGGGGNFGVVTSFKFQAHPVATVFGGPTFFRLNESVMRNYQALLAKIPRQLNALLAMVLAPPAPFVPESWHNKPVIAVLTAWSGPENEDQRILDAVSDMGEVVGQAVWRMPYPEINTFFDELLPHGLRHYWKANAFMEFSDEAISAHLEHGAKVANPESGYFCFPIDGACHDVSPEDTAFANRHTNFSGVIAGTWHEEKDDTAYTGWVRDYYTALKPSSESGAYVNFMAEDDEDQVDENYGPKLQRLKEIKRIYDPDNLFRVNMNIRPD